MKDDDPCVPNFDPPRWLGPLFVLLAVVGFIFMGYLLTEFIPFPKFAEYDK